MSRRGNINSLSNAVSNVAKNIRIVKKIEKRVVLILCSTYSERRIKKAQIIQRLVKTKSDNKKNENKCCIVLSNCSR